jgi:hypothetical protein
MTESHVLSGVDPVSETGEQIYRERYKAQYEAMHFGKYLAIAIVTSEATLADEAVDALEQAHKAHPDHMLYLLKIGSRGVYNLGSAFQCPFSGFLDQGGQPA